MRQDKVTLWKIQVVILLAAIFCAVIRTTGLITGLALIPPLVRRPLADADREAVGDLQGYGGVGFGRPVPRLADGRSR